jgi:glycosyltransferase involved in cell wall biosynthesis
MAVHFRVSLADEHAEPGREIRRDGIVFRWIRQAERDTIPRLDGLVHVSAWARDSLLSWLPEAEAVPSSVISNFVDAPDARPSEELLGDLVSTGKLEDRKNHRFLLEVLAEANRVGRPLTLDVFGDGPLRRELPELARSLGLASEVRFRGFRTDVSEFLPRYRAYVHAASAESAAFPLAIIEAMAAGLPVVAADVAGISELCHDGVEARFWSLDDPVEAAAIVIALLDDEPGRLRAAAASSERFRREFAADVVGPRLWSFLQGHGGAVVTEASRRRP